MDPFFIVIFSFLGVVLLFKAMSFGFNVYFEKLKLQARINELEAKCGMNQTKFESWFDTLEDVKTTVNHNYIVPPEKPKPLIESDVLMFMIKSCHPDRYPDDAKKGGLAKRATDWLLAQKNKQRQQGF